MIESKKPEITLIISMTDYGLIGNGDKMPWKSSLDFLWFQSNTMGWPCIFGGKTAQGMPRFPLKNRACATVTKDHDTSIVPAVFGNGDYMRFGQGGWYDALGEALRFYENYDKIFICGGASLYETSLKAQQPWLDFIGTPALQKPMIDTIIKTTFSGNNVAGNVFMKPGFLKMMTSPHFDTFHYQDYELNVERPGHYTATNWQMHPENTPGIITMPMEYELQKNDTPFNKIRFEILKRHKENVRK